MLFPKILNHGKALRLFIYSLLNDSTGSFLAAIIAGLFPAIKLNTILSNISIIALLIGSVAIPLIFATFPTIRLTGTDNKHAIPTPNIPEIAPSIIIVNTK